MPTLPPFITTGFPGITLVWPHSHGANAGKAEPDCAPVVAEMTPGAALVFLVFARFVGAATWTADNGNGSAAPGAAQDAQTTQNAPTKDNKKTDDTTSPKQSAELAKSLEGITVTGYNAAIEKSIDMVCQVKDLGKPCHLIKDAIASAKK